MARTVLAAAWVTTVLTVLALISPARNSSTAFKMSLPPISIE